MKIVLPHDECMGPRWRQKPSLLLVVAGGCRGVLIPVYVIRYLFAWKKDSCLLVVLMNMTVMIHIVFVKDLCIRRKGIIWPDVSRHDLP